MVSSFGNHTRINPGLWKKLQTKLKKGKEFAGYLTVS
jgi:hypothetical protein